MRAILEPRPQFGGVLQHAVLDVNLVLLVAREGGIEAGQEPVAVKGGQLVLEQEIGVAPRIAEEQPIAADGAGRAALLQKGAERRNPGAGADHNHRAVGRREAKAVAGAHKDWHGGVRLCAVAEKGRGNAAAPPCAPFVAYRRDGQMDRAVAVLWGRGDRIKPGLQRIEGRDQLG